MIPGRVRPYVQTGTRAEVVICIIITMLIHVCTVCYQQSHNAAIHIAPHTEPRLQRAAARDAEHQEDKIYYPWAIRAAAVFVGSSSH